LEYIFACTSFNRFHEAARAFMDRLISTADRELYQKAAETIMENKLQVQLKEIFQSDKNVPPGGGLLFAREGNY
jgi:hypothetical protein